MANSFPVRITIFMLTNPHEQGPAPLEAGAGHGFSPQDSTCAVDIAAASNDNPMLLMGMSVSRAAVHIGTLIVFFAILAFLASFALQCGMTEEELKHSPLVLLASTLLIWVVVIAAGIALLARIKLGIDSIGLTYRKLLPDCLLGVAVAVASFLVFLLTVGVIWLVWPAGYDQLNENPKNIMQMIPRLNPASLFLLMLAVGVMEEAVFRGLLLPHLRRITGNWVAAALLTSAAFVAMHQTQQFAAIFPLFAVALLWSAVTIWRRSLVSAIVGHAIFNFCQILLVYRYHAA